MIKKLIQNMLEPRRGSESGRSRRATQIRKLKHAVRIVASLRDTERTHLGYVPTNNATANYATANKRTHLGYVPTYFSRFNVLSLSLFLMGMITTACSDEITPPEPEQPLEYTTFTLPGYLGVKIVSNDAASTRATTFDDGDKREFSLAIPTSTENYHYVLFYPNVDNALPAAVMNLDISDANRDQNSTDNITLTIKDAYIAKALASNLKTEDDLRSWLGDKKVYVLLNFTKDIISGGVEGTTTKEALSKLTQKRFTEQLQLKDYKISVDENDYFVMSNSVYVSGGRKIDGAINSNKVKEKKADALGDPGIEVYVERVAVKYTVNFNKSIINGSVDNGEFPRITTGNTTVKVFNPLNGEYLIIGAESYEIPTDEKGWQVEVLGYGLNALEQSSYLFKNITTTSLDPWTSTSMNDTGNHRSHWAEDEHYTMPSNDSDLKKYPDQFRRSLEETFKVREMHNKNHTSDGLIDVTDTLPTYLHYRPYNYFKGLKGNPYAFENTYYDPTEKLGKRGYFSASTHLIMVGKLRITDVSQNLDLDLYYDQNSIFYKSAADLFKAKLELLNKIHLKDGNHGLRVLDVDWLNDGNWVSDPDDVNGLTKLSWGAGCVLWVQYSEQYAKQADESDFRFIPAEIGGGDGSVLIAPNAEIKTIYLAPVKENGSMDSEASGAVIITPNQLISLFHKMIGVVDHYKDCMVYYAAGIPHSVTEITDISSKTPGAVGSVRNNWYDITINEIVGVGRPVDDPSQPIIPTVEVKRSYLNMTVKIADWHKISQTVDEGNLGS